MDKKDKIKCSVKSCEKTFINLYNLRRHTKQFHSKEELLYIYKKNTNFKFSCDICNKNFNKNNHLQFHKRKIHPSPAVIGRVNSSKCSKKCPMCSFTDNEKKIMYSHFKEHDINIQEKMVNFSSHEEFIKWKSQFEIQSGSNFTLEKTKKTKQYKTYFYICHRSGFYKSRGNGVRHLKTQGSCKMDAYCPASVTVNIDREKKCSAIVIETHVGHSLDLSEKGHLHLSLQERKTLAMKIASKIPFDAILDEIRDSVTDNVQRIHLLTKKDLYNIESSFNLSSTSVRHSKDAVSVESWVNQMKEDCVLYYKPQDTLADEHPELKSEDFVLIIMKEAQSDMLKKFGNDCVCVDGTHGLNGYNFEMNTILVIDDMRQGFPCAFLISNRSDEVIFRIFYSYVKLQTGSIFPKVFMSDMADSPFKAWLAVMGEPSFRLYCTWHVDRAWRKNLFKIKTKEKQVATYKKLRVMLEETDLSAFHVMINEFSKQLQEDPETKEFGKYFEDNYIDISSRWAYCHRLNSGINTNMHIERMHKTIKYIYLHGKNNKRLDKAIHALMKFVRDKFFDRLIILTKGKITSKLKDIRSRHKASVNLRTELITENNEGWDIPSSSKEQCTIYHVEELLNNCSCQLICTECNTCIHRYSCSCIDASIRWNMCKHIHLLCKYRQEKRDLVVATISDKDEEDHLYIDMTNKRSECEDISGKISKKNIREDEFQKTKQNLIEDITQKIKNINSPSKLEIIKKMLAPISPTLKANQNQNLFTTAGKEPASVPHNKKIEVQRRLFSTKKKPRRNEKSIKKPDTNESQSIAITLLNKVQSE